MTDRFESDDPPSPQVAILGLSECLDLLRSGDVGRIAWQAADGPKILPVNYVFHDGLAYFRTSPQRDLVRAGPSLRRGAGSRRPGPPVADRLERGRALARPGRGGTAACNGAVANGPDPPLGTGDQDCVHPGDAGRNHRPDRKSSVTLSPQRLRPGGQRSGGSRLVSKLAGTDRPPDFAGPGPEQPRLSIERLMNRLLSSEPRVVTARGPSMCRLRSE